MSNCYGTHQVGFGLSANQPVLLKTETWLSKDVDFNLDSFKTIRFHKEQKTWKSVGGGLCMAVNKRWVSNLETESWKH